MAKLTSGSPLQVDAVARRISLDRLAPYRTVTMGSASHVLREALELYQRNAVLSGEFWTLLGYVEVVVRNALHERLIEWSIRSFDEPRWYLDPSRVFNDRRAAEIAVARTRIASTGKLETAGRVVAELPFGFWRFLLAPRHERTLWRTCLHSAFPGQGRRKAVHAKLAALHELRNRIAHHEPIHNRPLQRLYDDALTLTGWICPTTRDWMQQQHLVPSLTVTAPAP